MVHNPVTAGHGKEFSRITNQATSWDGEDKTSLSISNHLHVQHISLTLREGLDDGPLVFFRSINLHALKGLTLDSIDFLDNHFWTGNLQFITFTAHGFNEDRQVEFTTA